MANTRYDEQRIDVESQVPRETAHHVDISGAKREFKELSRQLSGRYQKNPSTTGSEESSSGRDVEKGGVEEERFDLREYLTSSNDAHQQAGVKHKVHLFSQCGCVLFTEPLACWRCLGRSPGRGYWWWWWREHEGQYYMRFKWYIA